MRSAVNLSGSSKNMVQLIARQAIELAGADHASIAVPADPSAEQVTNYELR